jgi:uncharacterized protein (DUF736 family)
MANALGYVTETKTGFEGALAMMNLSSPIRIAKNAEKAAEGQPDYRIFAGDTATEIGGGWVRKAKGSGRDYNLDHPRGPADRPPQDRRKPRPGQRQEGPPCDPLEPEGIDISPP